MGGTGGAMGPPPACVAGSNPTCEGDFLKECQSNGTLNMTPCKRGCGNSMCCGGNTEGVGGSCASCGVEGGPCCKIATPACGPNLTCKGGTCVVPCGGTGQTCCDGATQLCMNKCTTGMRRCIGGQWDESGCPRPNVQCCTPGTTCGGDAEVTCSNDGVETRKPCSSGKCSNNRCTTCGGSGDDCCPTSPRCGDGLSCQGTRCASCGGNREACCNGTSGCAAGFVCRNMKCGPPCGDLGQDCCSGSCNSGPVPLGCFNNQCEPCGIQARRCCPSPASPCGSNLVCDSGTCNDCGSPGQRCCDNNTCPGGGSCSAGTCS
jgi:hypothetical protein